MIRLLFPVFLVLSAVVGGPAAAQSDTPPIYIEGRWSWKASCGAARYSGEWIIRQKADGTFEGDYGNTNIADVGTIEGGWIKGREIRFVHAYRHLLWGPVREQVRGKYRYVNGTDVVFDGTATSPGHACTYEARRKEVNTETEE